MDDLNPTIPSHKIALGLHWMRKRKGLTMQTLADAIGRTRGCVQRWEVASSEPQINEVGEVAAKMGHRLLIDIVPEDEAVERERIENALASHPLDGRLATLRGLAAIAEVATDPTVLPLLARTARILLTMPREERAGFIRGLEMGVAVGR